MFNTALQIVLRFASRLKGIDLSELLNDSALFGVIATLVYKRLRGKLDIGDGVLLRDILKTLWENLDEVIAIVIELLTLFGVVSTPVMTISEANATAIEADFNALCDAL